MNSFIDRPSFVAVAGRLEAYTVTSADRRTVAQNHVWLPSAFGPRGVMSRFPWRMYATVCDSRPAGSRVDPDARVDGRHEMGGGYARFRPGCDAGEGHPDLHRTRREDEGRGARDSAEGAGPRDGAVADRAGQVAPVPPHQQGLRARLASGAEPPVRRHAQRRE